MRKTYRDLILCHALVGMDVHCSALYDEHQAGVMDQFTAWVNAELLKEHVVKNVKKKQVFR